MKRCLIIAEGYYPIGSLSIRIRMWAKGFLRNNVLPEIFIVAPPPTILNVHNSEDYVTFAQKPIAEEEHLSMVKYLIYRILGLFKLHIFIRKKDKIDFLILPRPNILLGIYFLIYCKITKAKLFFDKGDANARLIDKKSKTSIDVLAKLNQVLFEKYIIPRVDVLFVVSSYLEKQYRTKYPTLKVKRCLPSLIDINEFNVLKANDISTLKITGIQIFNSNRIKVFYAGSCERVNGLFFFLECASNLIDKGINEFEIIFIFVDGDVSKIKNKCIELGIIKHVTFLEKVLPKYMPAIYQKVDILVLPEQGNIIANAGFPGKTGEYLASGKAILSTIFSDLAEHLHHEKNAMLSDIGDKLTYTKNFERLIVDNKLREKLGHNSVQTAINNFDYCNGVITYIEEI